MTDVANLDWANVPVRWRKPTTRWSRSVRRRFQHEPIDARHCTCGDEFPDAAANLKHQRAFGSAWWRVRFRINARGTGQVATPLAGHRMTYTPSARRHWGQVRCRCGWASASKRIRRPGVDAREHSRTVVRQRLGLVESTPTT